MEKNWAIKSYGASKYINHLSEALNINKTLANLLVHRGIKNFNEAKSFFRPSLDNLHDPFLMKDMEKAVERIQSAIESKEKILVYGDYDVDGTTSVALVYSFFSKFYDKIDYYIPDRYGEGYGISLRGIEYAEENTFSLIIALDCGIKAVEKVKIAKQKGIDFIICDHHTAGENVPNAAAVLDPKRTGCDYPFKELSGCAVGFKLLQAYAKKNNIPDEEIYSYLDLVAVSIASDIVPLTGENRIMAYFGLKKINEDPQTGLKAIIKLSGLVNREICVSDIVFKIGPRINAAGRMESGKRSVDLLISTDDNLSMEMGHEINTYNQERRNIDNSITQEALQIISSDVDLKNRKTTVLFNSAWHKGVVGIVASRLTESYYRPTVVLTESNGLATGSARSVAGYDLYQAIDSCADLLENFGGHMYAAGLTLKISNVPLFRERFEKVVGDTILPDQLIPKIDVDGVISLNDITPKFYRILKQFEPFGPENMKPVFITENVVDNGDGRLVGSNSEHLKLCLIQEDDPYKVYDAIAFQQSPHFNRIKKGIPFDICYTIEENEYMGNVSLQLRVKDIKFD